MRRRAQVAQLESRSMGAVASGNGAVVRGRRDGRGRVPDHRQPVRARFDPASTSTCFWFSHATFLPMCHLAVRSAMMIGVSTLAGRASGSARRPGARRRRRPGPGRSGRGIVPQRSRGWPRAARRRRARGRRRRWALRLALQVAAEQPIVHDVAATLPMCMALDVAPGDQATERLARRVGPDAMLRGGGLDIA